MGTYQGKALQAPRPRRRGGRGRAVVRVLGVILVVAVLAHVP